MTAASNAKARNAQSKKIRQFITPEGVDLQLRIASAGLRLGALIVDLILIAAALFAFLIFGEAIGLSQAAGGLMILGGIWIARPRS